MTFNMINLVDLQVGDIVNENELLGGGFRRSELGCGYDRGLFSYRNEFLVYHGHKIDDHDVRIVSYGMLDQEEDTRRLNS